MPHGDRTHCVWKNNLDDIMKIKASEKGLERKRGVQGGSQSFVVGSARKSKGERKEPVRSAGPAWNVGVIERTPGRAPGWLRRLSHGLQLRS